MRKENSQINPFIFRIRQTNNPEFENPLYEALVLSLWKEGLRQGEGDTPLADIVSNARRVREYPQALEWFARGVAWGSAVGITREKGETLEKLKDRVLAKARITFESLQKELSPDL